MRSVSSSSSCKRSAPLRPPSRSRIEVHRPGVSTDRPLDVFNLGTAKGDLHGPRAHIQRHLLPRSDDIVVKIKVS